MDTLEIILSHPAWEGVAALIAILAFVLPLFAKMISFLFLNQKVLVFVKQVVSMTLLASLFIPLVASPFYPGSVFDEVYVVLKNFDSFDIKFFFIAKILAFIWPMVFVFSFQFGPQILKLLLRAIEPVLCIGTFYILLLIIPFNEQLSLGGYIAFVSIMVYFLSSLLEISGGIIYGIRVALVIIFLSLTWSNIRLYIEQTIN